MNAENDSGAENADRDQNESKSSIRITAVCGSLSARSTTKMALSVTLKGASEYDVSTSLIELRDYEMVFYGAVEDENMPADVLRLRKEIKESNGIILGTPEYHGSLSGAMKNMLDLMGADEFEGKIVGLVAVAGGHTGAINSLNTLRTIGRNLHCWILPQQVSIADSHKMFNDDGSVTDQSIEDRLMNLGRQVVKFASLQKKIQQNDFMKMWEGLPRW